MMAVCSDCDKELSAFEIGVCEDCEEKYQVPEPKFACSSAMTCSACEYDTQDGQWVDTKTKDGVTYWQCPECYALTKLDDVYTETKPNKNYTVLGHNVGSSNYAQKGIQPWQIWEEYELNPWDADIVKRILRTKKIEGMTADEARIEDYEKIIHICQYRVAKLKGEL